MSTPRWGIERGGWRNGRPVDCEPMPAPRGTTRRVTITGGPVLLVDANQGTLMTLRGDIILKSGDTAYNFNGSVVDDLAYGLARVYPCTIS